MEIGVHNNYTKNNRGSKIWQVSGQFISINSVIFKSCPCFIKPCCFYTEKGNVILVVLIYPNTLQSVRFSAQCPLGRLNPVARILWLITQKRINQLQNLHLHFSKCQSTSTGPLPLFGIFFYTQCEL